MARAVLWEESLGIRLRLGEEGRVCQATYHNDVLMLLSGQVCVLKNWAEKEGKRNQQKWVFNPKDPQHCRLFSQPSPPTTHSDHVLDSTYQGNSGTGQESGYILVC